MKIKTITALVIVAVIGWYSGAVTWLTGTSKVSIPHDLKIPDSVAVPNIFLAIMGVIVVLWLTYKAIVASNNLLNNVLSGGMNSSTD